MTKTEQWQKIRAALTDAGYVATVEESGEDVIIQVFKDGKRWGMRLLVADAMHPEAPRMAVDSARRVVRP